MKLPQHPALPLVSVALFGYLLGDVTCAVLERQFNLRPPRQNGSSQGVGATVPLNMLKGRGELTALLTSRKPLEADPGALQNPTPGTSPSLVPGQNPPAAAGVNATALPQLAGTMEGQGQALAVLQMGQETQVVGVGEEWMGFRVIEVGAFQARLRDARNQEYTISMGLANVATSTNSTLSPGLPGPPAFNVTGGPGGLGLPAGPYKTSRELREDLENKGQWVRNILVQPVMRNGESVGVQVNYNNPSNPFARLGIQSGDIVLALNQKPARGVEDVTNLVMELRNSTVLNFQLERGGQQLPLTVTLEP